MFRILASLLCLVFSTSAYAQLGNGLSGVYVKCSDAGIPLDANGWTVFNASTTGNVYYISTTAEGNDTNTGLSPTPNPGGSGSGPWATVEKARAFQQANNNKDDWFLFRKGATWTNQYIGGNIFQINGKDCTHPALFGSYTPSQPGVADPYESYSIASITCSAGTATVATTTPNNWVGINSGTYNVVITRTLNGTAGDYNNRYVATPVDASSFTIPIADGCPSPTSSATLPGIVVLELPTWAQTSTFTGQCFGNESGLAGADFLAFVGIKCTYPLRNYFAPTFDKTNTNGATQLECMSASGTVHHTFRMLEDTECSFHAATAISYTGENNYYIHRRNRSLYGYVWSGGSTVTLSGAGGMLIAGQKEYAAFENIDVFNGMNPFLTGGTLGINTSTDVATWTGGPIGVNFVRLFFTGSPLPTGIVAGTATSPQLYCTTAVSGDTFQLKIYQGLDGVSAAINTAGTGYAVNDVLTVSGGVFSYPMQITVNSLGASNSISTFTVTQLGLYTTSPGTSGIVVTGGSGSGAKFNLTFSQPFPCTSQTVKFNTSGTGVTAWVYDSAANQLAHSYYLQNVESTIPPTYRTKLKQNIITFSPGTACECGNFQWWSFNNLLLNDPGTLIVGKGIPRAWVTNNPSTVSYNVMLGIAPNFVGPYETNANSGYANSQTGQILLDHHISAYSSLNGSLAGYGIVGDNIWASNQLTVTNSISCSVASPVTGEGSPNGFFTITNAGSGYTPGTGAFVYNNQSRNPNIPLIGGHGNSGYATSITVTNGVVTTVTRNVSFEVSYGYQVGDILTVDNQYLGGEGSGLLIVVKTVNSAGVITSVSINPVDGGSGGSGYPVPYVGSNGFGSAASGGGTNVAMSFSVGAGGTIIQAWNTAAFGTGWTSGVSTVTLASAGATIPGGSGFVGTAANVVKNTFSNTTLQSANCHGLGPGGTDPSTDPVGTYWQTLPYSYPKPIPPGIPSTHTTVWQQGYLWELQLNQKSNWNSDLMPAAVNNSVRSQFNMSNPALGQGF